MSTTALIIGLILFAVYLYLVLREDREDEVRDPDVMPAFDADVDLAELRSDPSKLDELARHVTSVGIVSAPESAVGIRTGGRITPHFEAYLVDTNGAFHTVVEGKDRSSVEKEARWLADQLDVPLQDGADGGPDQT